MSAGEVLPAMQALDELLAAVRSVPVYRLRIPPRTAVTFAVSLGHHGIARQVVMVEDPTLRMGQAVWMPPFEMPYRCFIIRGAQADVMAWCGPRGVTIGRGGFKGERGWAMWVDVPDAYRHVRPHDDECADMGVVTLPSWPGPVADEVLAEWMARGAVTLPVGWTPDFFGVGPV